MTSRSTITLISFYAKSTLSDFLFLAVKEKRYMKVPIIHYVNIQQADVTCALKLKQQCITFLLSPVRPVVIIDVVVVLLVAL